MLTNFGSPVASSGRPNPDVAAFGLEDEALRSIESCWLTDRDCQTTTGRQGLVKFRELVTSRRSAALLDPPAPDDHALRHMVELAATAPDHAKLSPWRLVTVRDEERQLLGGTFATAACVPDHARDRVAAKAFRAPLLVTIIFCPVEHRTVPRWEQLAATSCVINTLILLLHDSGWGSIWRSGTMVDNAAVRLCFEVGRAEQILGWLYVGTVREGTLGRRTRPPLSPGKVTRLSDLSGTVERRVIVADTTRRCPLAL